MAAGCGEWQAILSGLSLTLPPWNTYRFGPCTRMGESQLIGQEEAWVRLSAVRLAYTPMSARAWPRLLPERATTSM